MGMLAIGLSLNFGLAGTIVQERSPGPLRGRISAIFGLSFFGLMPLAGLIITGLADLIGMRMALAVAASLFAIGAVTVLTAAGRTGCECPKHPCPRRNRRRASTGDSCVSMRFLKRVIREVAAATEGPRMNVEALNRYIVQTHRVFPL